MELRKIERINVAMVTSTVEHPEVGTIIVKDLIEKRPNGLRPVVDSYYLDLHGNPIEDSVLLEKVDEFLSNDEEWEKEMGR